MIPLTAAQVAATTGGRVVSGPPDVLADGEVVVDSRRAGPGAVFVALPGERVDGHDHAGAAVAAGATVILAERAVDVPATAAVVVVADGVAALGALAASVLAGLDPVVVGVTGSQGKTTTKDLLAGLLAPLGPVVAPHGNLNNEIGVPLTVLRADAGTRALVVEMGARGVGHIAELCRIAPPRVGVVLAVGSAHASEFGSIEATAQAKGELVEALAPEGLAVLNADDPRVAAMRGRTRARVLTFGRSRHADVRAEDVRLDEEARARFTLVGPDGEHGEVALRLHGEHQVGNALAAAAVALGLDLPVAGVAAALSAAEAGSPGRMQVLRRTDGITVVDDAYNANPESVRAALKALVGMAGGRRTWAVLGEMLELGPDSRDEHDAIGRLAVRLDVSRVLVVGAGARPVFTGAVMEGSWGEEAAFVADTDAALDLLRAELRPGDVVLVKSSHGAGLHTLAAALRTAEVPA
ncbi:UDP-N-acetylmuramoyl-tripeptide--D-alanyl-D-alanine ligase [Kineococcus gynurae]|uniref:UDP-N-acetylmuramoyl-tripeptide--D-alanyl-D-alanine ligase n=1 Tax=Kineococcus gynurae TaxID=452979 RepID=A0ABV5LXQ9_9ACTN